jgi:hypothetical protein
MDYAQAYLAPGESTLISDPDEAAGIRAIVDDFRSGAHGELLKYPPYPIRDEQSVSSDPLAAPDHTYSIWIRDTTPLEDENGLIPLL